MADTGVEAIDSKMALTRYVDDSEWSRCRIDCGGEYE